MRVELSSEKPHKGQVELNSLFRWERSRNKGVGNYLKFLF